MASNESGGESVRPVYLAEIGHPFVDQDEAGRAVPEDVLEKMGAGRDSLGVVLGNRVEGRRSAQLPGHLAPGRADLPTALAGDRILRTARGADNDRAFDSRRHGYAVFREKLIESRQVLRRCASRHVVERKHGVGFAAAEVGLKLHYGVTARPG